MKQLISSDQAKRTNKQHTKACSDCPFGRKSLKGWLGNMSAQDWLMAAHGEATADCHVTTNQQCAGMAIYRANVGKIPRNQRAMQLPQDKANCFASPREFKEHHENSSGGKQCDTW